MNALRWLTSALPKMFYLVPPSALALDDTDEAPRWLTEEGVPLFFLLMIFEWLWIRATRRPNGGGSRPIAPYYRMPETLVSIMLGAIQHLSMLLLDVLNLFATVSAYRYVYTHYRLLELDPKARVLLYYVALLFGKDLLYYAAHRFMHEYHVGWISHSVHHSGEDYNLGTGLRQGVLQPLVTKAFYLPLALLGFHPHAFSAHAQLNTLYQFWIHTDLIDRLPFGLEYIFNSPSSHRMHHRPPAHCNYAALLIIWDRMFGTYKAEVTRRDHYGHARQLNTFDPLVLNTQHLARMRNTPTRRSLCAWLLARRVRRNCVCAPRLLCRSIPASGKDERATPRRTKWNGARGTQPLSHLAAAGLLLFGAAAVTFSFATLVKAPSLHPADLYIAVAVAIALCHAVCLVCDFRAEVWHRALLSGLVLLPTLAALLAAQPVATWANGRATHLAVRNFSAA